MSSGRVRLRISLTYPASAIQSHRFRPEYTGDEACRAALRYLGRDPDPAYRVFLQDDSGQERWLSRSARLCDQGVGDGMLLHILVPPPPQSSPPTAQAPSAGGSGSAPFPSVCAAEVAKPGFDVPLDRFYVNLADYKKLKKIGGGRFARVYSVRERATGAVFAMKEFIPDVNDAEQRESYRLEVVLLATLRHPAILGLHGCTPFDREEGAAILTPLMSASLQTYVDAERARAAPPFWTPTQKHVVLLGIASGMAFMHEQRCIHGNLKPANVLLDDQCNPRICDFGLSTFVEPGATLSQSMHRGTPQFMAPEVLLGDPFDFKIDVYAFAILMFVVLTGLDPFPDCRNQMILARRVTKGERPTIPDSVNPAYARLMAQCWKMMPGDRPGFSEIAHRLGEEDCLEGLDLDAVKAFQARV